MLPKIFQKKNFPFLLLIPMFLFLGILYLVNGKDAKNFEKISNAILKEELGHNTLSLHYTFSNPESYGLSDYEVTLPLYTKEKALEDYKKQQVYLDALHKINPDKLSPASKDTYTLLESHLILALNSRPYLYFEEPLSPSSGMQSNLPILLAEYTFRSKQDVDDYLVLLEDIDDYFSSLIQFEKEKKEAGLLQADSSLEKVRKQCDTILTAKDLENGTHFLQTTFQNRLQSLENKGLITGAEYQKYVEENNRILTTIVLPAYEKLSDELFLLMGSDKTLPWGLCYKKEGREYYEWLVHSLTGSDKSIEELKAMLYLDFGTSYQDLYEALESTDNASLLWLDALAMDTFPLHSPEEMLTDLQNRIREDFPSLPNGNAPYLVKEVDSSLSPYCAPAFYLTPPLDDTDNNVIYINESEEKCGLELYTTLAHEGYPGHLYQAVYTNRSLKANQTDPLRALLNYPGFQEGYALYVEFLSYDYAMELMKEKGKEDLSCGIEIEKYNRRLQLSLLAFLDISIHYDGAGLSDVERVLSSIGITDLDTVKNVYTYIAEEPANYLKYYIGYLEIESLKETVKEKLGKEYSDFKFHKLLMEFGPADFPYLTNKILSSILS